MKKDQLRKAKLVNKLRNWSLMTVKDENQREIFTSGLSNLSERQLFQLVDLAIHNPGFLPDLIKRIAVKNAIIKSGDSRAWAELIEDEGAELGQQFLAIIREDSEKRDRKKLDELRKSL